MSRPPKAIHSRRAPAALPKIAPLVLKRMAEAFDHADWLFEVKYDWADDHRRHCLAARGVGLPLTAPPQEKPRRSGAKVSGGRFRSKAPESYASPVVCALKSARVRSQSRRYFAVDRIPIHAERRKAAQRLPALQGKSKDFGRHRAVWYRATPAVSGVNSGGKRPKRC